ncbi:MAG TPA: hypothetical protein VNK43_09635 [Gemmatimonadales bacterium]|nr:hypothetical protein [Gemmatimonadales bacterium]
MTDRSAIRAAVIPERRGDDRRISVRTLAERPQHFIPGNRDAEYRHDFRVGGHEGAASVGWGTRP